MSQTILMITGDAGEALEIFYPKHRLEEEGWRVAIERRHLPSTLVFTRQNLPIYDRSALGSAEGARNGAYVLADAEGANPDVILIGTGSEVEIAMQAREKLQADGVKARVVSMPSWELFEQQPGSYKDQVLPPAIRARVAVEAGVPQGWHRWVGDLGEVVALERFGASAPYLEVYQHLGITADHVVERARNSMARATAAGKGI